jgi:citrate lyase beta subunit
MDTEWFQDDLAVALDASPDAILLPKAAVESVEALAEAIGGATKIWGLVERIRDVLAIEALASLGALDVVTIGYGDLCKELGVPLGSAHPEFVGVRELVVAAARRHDIVALDGVFIGSADASGAACAESRAAGFAGRTLYRPAHVAGCHDAFTAAV